MDFSFKVVVNNTIPTDLFSSVTSLICSPYWKVSVVFYHHSVKSHLQTQFLPGRDIMIPHLE